MNRNLYTKGLQVLLMFFFFLGNLPLLNAQNCPTANRTASNCKANSPDEIGAVLKNFFQGEGIDKASWLFEAGATFVENGDGTADLNGVLAQYPLPSTRRFQVSVHFINQTYTTPAGSPMLLNTTPNTAGWYYYNWGTATLTGLSDLAGAQVNLTERGKAAQMGIGGADQVPDINNLGMSAWFNWEVVAQPSNASIVINPFPSTPSIDQGDFCLTMSGTPTVCAPTACIGGLTYCDNNNNGVFDAGDAPATNLTITLCDANFNLITTQAVDANGKYLFANLAAGTYNIKFPTATLDGKPLATSSPVNVILANGQKVNDINAGYFKPAPPPTACIGGLTYCDNNNNGVYDAGDVIATNLTITLCDAGFNTLATQAVDANGKYLFANLAAGTYNIKFPTATLDGKPLRTTSPVNVVLADGQKVTNINAGYFKPCAAIFDVNKCYRIVNVLSGKAVDVLGGSTANDAKIVQWAWHGGANQVWQIVPTTNGFVKIVNRNSKKVIACHYSTSGTPVYQYDYYDGGAKEWKIECTTEGYKLTHRLSGKFMTVPNNSTADGTQFTINTWANSKNQMWRIEEVACPVPPCAPIVTFYNKANMTVNLFLISGTTKTHIKQLTAGQSCAINAKDGQIYRACSASSGATLTEYKVAGCNAQTVNITSANLTCNLSFYNKTNSICYVYWIDSYGKKILYKTLYGNQYYTQSTFFGHKWMVCNAFGQTLSNYAVNKYGSSWCNIYASYCSWSLTDATVLALDARQISGRVTLNFSNNTGFKNDYFILQRKDNQTGLFNDLAVTNNFQDNDELSIYTEHDDAPQADENVYRVKLAQYDGTIQYSEEKTVKYSSKYDMVRLFPNPAYDVLNVDLSQYEGRSVTITLYDRLGKVVKTQIIDSASNAPFQMNVDDAQSGQYMLRVYSEGKRDVVKQVILTK